MSAREQSAQFDCFGSRVGLYVGGRDATRALEGGRELLLDLHATLSRFDSESELSRLNRDPRPTVAASVPLRLLAEAAVQAGARSGGLVDATCIPALQRAGYAASRDPLDSLDPETLLDGPHATSAPSQSCGGWADLVVDHAAGTVSRPPGVMLDSGGLGKGLAADMLADRLLGEMTFAVDCGGDLRLGGTAGAARRIGVADPLGRGELHAFELAEGAVATSGITKRSWRTDGARVAHHLIDPRTGAPAFTGVIQVTALAPSALEAEVLAKTALLRGSSDATETLEHGGVVVLCDGTVEIREPSLVRTRAAA